MFKKALSLLLAVMLIVTAFSVAMVSVAADSASALNVTATSNFFPTSTKSFSQEEIDANDGYVTVTYFIQSEERLLNLDFMLTYDGTVLQFDEAANMTGSGRNAKLNVLPIADDAIINTNPTSVEYGVKGNCTNLSTYYLNAEDGGKTPFVTATFKVIGSGDTTVNLNINDMKWARLEEGQTQADGSNDTQMVEGGTVLDNEMVYDTTTAVYGGAFDPDYVEPEVTEPSSAPEEPASSEQPASSEPEEPVVDEDTYVVAGDNAEIFGTSWDAANTDNSMTKNQDGTFSKDYTVSKAYEVSQLKVVKNGAEWIGDADGNNIAFSLTGPGTFTVTYNPADNSVTVTGDNVASATFNYNTVYAVGNGEDTWLNGASWDPGYAANEMSKVADGVYEIEFNDVPDGFERQIKFAIDGSWTYNFGAPKEDTPEFVSGQVFDAAWDGGNITFDTDDVCDVKAQLDLRDFDFATKTGAKYTITITYQGDDPEPSSEPGEETQPTEPTPVTGDGLTVIATSNFFPETRTLYSDFSSYEDENGDVFITVEYGMAAAGKYLINLDVDELTWDPSVLEFKEEYNKFGSGRSAVFSIFPFAVEQGRGAGMVNTFGNNNGGRIVGNYTSVAPAAYATEEDGSEVIVVRATFKLLNRDAKTTTVNCVMDTLSLCDETIQEPYAQDMPIDKLTINPDAYQLGVYSTKIIPAGEETPVPSSDVEPSSSDVEPSSSEVEPSSSDVEPSSDEPVDELTVTGTSNFSPAVAAQTVKVGESVTVTFTAPENYSVVDIQWGMNYDSEKLNLTGCSTIMPDDMLINPAAASFNVLGSATNIDNPGTVVKGEELATFVFEALGDGETEVEFVIVDMTVKDGENDTVIFINGEDQREPEPEPSSSEVEPSSSDVEPSSSDVEPSGSDVEPVDTVIVAGDTTDFFGTSWDGTNEANAMTKGEDGKYTKEYTADKAYDVVQLKAVVNGADWYGDADGNNVAFALTGPGTFTVTYDPETNTVSVTGDNVVPATFNYENVFAVGNGEGTWLNGVSWDPTAEANKMNKVADGVYEIEFNDVPDGFERQIKFAIDGSWTYNFGAPKEDAPEFVSGQEFDAAWDGGNITFDTDDLCDIKVQLDLSNFDFAGKTGAKYMITISEPEPTEPSSSEVEPSSSEVEPSSSEVEPSSSEVEPSSSDVEPPSTSDVEPDSSDVEPTTEPASVDVTGSTAGTSSSDATSATGGKSTPANATPSDGGSSTNTNGAVQTGTASMALIILLVLVSATAGIYFARKKVK